MSRAAELLAQIYGNPESDELRLVYADLLMEMGDPRGEFINLQMLPKRTRAQGKRATALLKQHRPELHHLVKAVSDTPDLFTHLRDSFYPNALTLKKWFLDRNQILSYLSEEQKRYFHFVVPDLMY